MRSSFLLILLIICLSCERIQKTTYEPLKLKGSESMHETFSALASDFQKNQDSLRIVIEGGGSRTGLMAIKESTADIGLSSFPFNLDSTLGADHGVRERVVAYDGIVVVSNKRNPVSSLTTEQVSAIYNGIVTDWSELGGNPGKILPIVRDSNSGTQRFFSEHFNIRELSPLSEEAKENHEIVNKVIDDENSIGYIGYAYYTDLVNELALPSRRSTSDSIRFVPPIPTYLHNDEYPLKRSLQIYYRNVNDARIKAFLHYLNSNRAKQIIEGYGLIPN